MSSHRTVKKVAYATAGGIITLGMFYLVISPFLPKSDQNGLQPTPTPSYEPVVVENMVVIPHIDKPGPSGKTIDIVARLKNKNVRAGTGNYPVTFVAKDPSGIQIGAVNQMAYVLPGGVQYLVGLDIPIPADKQFGSAEIITPPTTDLVALPDSAALPDFSVFLRDRTRFTSGSQVLERQTGIVTNNSTFDWERVEVTGVAFDESGKIIGVGKTFVGKLLVGEQREFTLLWPAPINPTNRVVAIATTNIYSSENVVHILGDPGRLR